MYSRSSNTLVPTSMAFEVMELSPVTGLLTQKKVKRVQLQEETLVRGPSWSNENKYYYYYYHISLSKYHIDMRNAFVSHSRLT
jgi:hypothetical protein